MKLKHLVYIGNGIIGIRFFKYWIKIRSIREYEILWKDKKSEYLKQKMYYIGRKK